MVVKPERKGSRWGFDLNCARRTFCGNFKVEGSLTNWPGYVGVPVLKKTLQRQWVADCACDSDCERRLVSEEAECVMCPDGRCHHSSQNVIILMSSLEDYQPYNSILRLSHLFIIIRLVARFSCLYADCIQKYPDFLFLYFLAIAPFFLTRKKLCWKDLSKNCFLEIEI